MLLCGAALLIFFCCILALGYIVFAVGDLLTRGKKLLEELAHKFR
tara:strand:+ start:2257 stop:2391 length:135 start_codon:yes stop_codon:yes gene_type:complete